MPKGGGAIRGTGEKFSANPATGSASLTIPLAVTPGRNGFGPSLSLVYESADGNGPWGLGWSPSLPSITRKTDKGLPRYAGDPEDVVVLSGAEDLVPELVEHDGHWLPRTERCVVDGVQYDVARYRPRVEGLFARIERWRACGSGEVHWRSLTRDNITTRYGATAESRIADPDDRTRVFSWLICDSHDDTGNTIVYDYKAEDGAGVDLTAAHERHRTPAARSANRYLKRIRYGNRRSRLDGPDPHGWLFEVVFDYGEHDLDDPTPREAAEWSCRTDPFSSYRAGFEVRTYRLCRRVLMFHHMPYDPAVGNDCLVRATELTYRPDLVATALIAVEQSGFRRTGAGGYVRRSLPPLELEYSTAEIDETVQTLAPDVLAMLPGGIDGNSARWTDLDGEGVSGVLYAQSSAWHYLRNRGDGRFGPRELVATLPTTADLGRGQQLLDLAGDGRLDLVQLHGANAGFHERTADGSWTPFRPFRSRPVADLDDEHVRFADLTGDGTADLLLLDDEALTWLPSLGEYGFAPGRRVFGVPGDVRGPRLIRHGRTETAALADMTGDNLADIVRIRNGEICYWPNLGHGRFGAMVRMDDAPWFDEPDRFDPGRVRLADLDGTGPTDLVYLHRDGVRLYRNRSGNGWTAARRLRTGFPRADALSDVSMIDLLGTGTPALVWSSPLPAENGRQVRYVELMRDKPHLLTRVRNNLGAETIVSYAPSTRYHLADKAAGRPWVTRLPFPIHVVAQVETVDAVSRNRLVTRYAYHHGDYDGVEREPRGFGMVEQWDAEHRETDPVGPDGAPHVPPVLTRTWFHTGVFLDGVTISRQFADEYFREAEHCPAEPNELELPDTVLPREVRRRDRAPLSHRFTADELRQACRALRGSILRQEVYAADGSAAQDRPYTVSERNYTLECLQPAAAGNRYAVFFPHPRETLTANYERTLHHRPDGPRADPRVTHELVLATDDFGNVVRSASVGYGRRYADPELPPEDATEQARLRLVTAEHRYTNAVDEPDSYRTPLRCESRAHEILGVRPVASRPGSTNPFGFAELAAALDAIAVELPFEDDRTPDVPARRLVEHSRTLFRRDDLDGPLPLGRLESMALPFEDHRLALTRSLRTALYGDRVDDAVLHEAGYARLPGHDGWWIPSGRIAYAPGPDTRPAGELAFARRHFFRPRRHTDPFGNPTEITYDPFDLLVQQTRDAVGNTVSAHNDYRVLQPRLIVDPNGNRAEAAFDALGLLTATAMRGKAGQHLGDSLDGIDPDPEPDAVIAYFTDPLADPHALLGGASTRLLHDLHAFRREGTPSVVATLSRETHVHALAAGERTRIQQGFAYSDGFGREVQRSLTAEPGADGRPRWVTSGWTIFNNKGRPVRQYEPFFSPSHRFTFAPLVGVSSVLCYDPLDRVVATLHPNGSWEKVVFDPWHQVTWDVNDTVLTDPRTDTDVGGFARPVLERGWVSWYDQRAGGGLGPAERAAAEQAAAHAATPARSWLDTLGRTFRTAAHNRADGLDEHLVTRLTLDVEGNEREVVDPLGRTVIRYRYDHAGARVAQASMEAGARSLLLDVGGNPVRTWTDRGLRFRVEYDPLRRPVRIFVHDGVRERLHERTEYGEDAPEAWRRNLRGQVHRRFDGAGIATNEEFDFLGNLAAATRRLAREVRDPLDWARPVALEDEVHRQTTRYDALSRPTAMTAPDGSAVRPRYDEAGRLDGLDARLPGATSDTPFLVEVDHNARGQRLRCRHGNGATTLYDYDPLTFRLRRLRTVRSRGGPLQDLRYAYDAAGNITRIADAAQQHVFFRNRRVEASADYRYDAVYRLVEATGREHLADGPVPTSATDVPRVGLPHPGDGDALGRYVERYGYDGAGNLLLLAHRGTDPAHPGWTRTFTHSEPSLLEPHRPSNRLTAIADRPGVAQGLTYDEHGNTTSLPGIAELRWDVDDQLSATVRQVVRPGGNAEATHYRYDAEGQRVRQVTVGANGRRHERIYLGGFEIHREYGPHGVTLERHTLHLTDDEQRIALVETRVHGDDRGPAQLQRYQLGNHLGSSVVELDDAAEIISYEEYYPYGGTSYQAARSRTETPKRYRYTGKERDPTGLYYHGARYYAPWLARWTSCDPLFLKTSTNRYRFVRNSPVMFTDPDGRQDVAIYDEAAQVCRAKPVEGPQWSSLPSTPQPLPASGAMLPTSSLEPPRSARPETGAPGRNDHEALSAVRIISSIPNSAVRITNALVDPEPLVFGLHPSNANASLRPAEHALGQHLGTGSGSPFISASMKPGGAAGIAGDTTLWIDIDKTVKSGTEFVDEKALVSDLDALAQAEPGRYGPRSEMWKNAQAGEREVLFRGAVPAGAVDTRAMRYLRYGGRAVQIGGWVMTAYDVEQAAEESARVGSAKPLVAEGVRQVGGWAAAAAGAKVGAAAGALLGIETGPGAIVTGLVGAAVVGGAGYFGFDWAADMIYEN